MRKHPRSSAGVADLAGAVMVASEFAAGEAESSGSSSAALNCSAYEDYWPRQQPDLGVRPQHAMLRSELDTEY